MGEIAWCIMRFIISRIHSYAGIIEALSGAPFDVENSSVLTTSAKDASILDDIDVILTVGDADTAYTGEAKTGWIRQLLEAVGGFVYRGGGLIGVGEPTAHQWQGRFIQLADVFSVECENGFNLNKDKYNWEEHPHFIMEDCGGRDRFWRGKEEHGRTGRNGNPRAEKSGKYRWQSVRSEKEEACIISGLPYSFENSRLLYRAVDLGFRRRGESEEMVQHQL